MTFLVKIKGKESELEKSMTDRDIEELEVVEASRPDQTGQKKYVEETRIPYYIRISFTSPVNRIK